MRFEKGFSTASKQLTGLAAKVIGVDISPHMQPDDMPENLWLQVSDPEPRHRRHGVQRTGIDPTAAENMLLPHCNVPSLETSLAGIQTFYDAGR